MNREFDLLANLVASLPDIVGQRLLLRPDAKDPFSVKDALAHITHLKSDAARSARGINQRTLSMLASPPTIFQAEHLDFVD